MRLREIGPFSIRQLNDSDSLIKRVCSITGVDKGARVKLNDLVLYTLTIHMVLCFQSSNTFNIKGVVITTLVVKQHCAVYNTMLSQMIKFCNYFNVCLGAWISRGLREALEVERILFLRLPCRSLVRVPLSQQHLSISHEYI